MSTPANRNAAVDIDAAGTATASFGAVPAVHALDAAIGSPLPPASSLKAWVIVAGLFVILTTSSGLVFYNHSLYMRSLSHERGLSLATLSGAISFFFVVSGVSGLVIARLIDRFDVRFTFVVGAFITGGALAMLGSVHSVLQLYAAYGCFGMGYAAVSLVPSTTIIARWFTTNRSVALSLASTGLSVGGVLLTPFCALSIAQYGMATVMPWLGLLLIAVVVPVALLTVRPWPVAMMRQRASAEGPPLAAGTELSTAIRSRFFRFGTAAYVFLMMSQVGGIAHQYTLGAERFTTPVAATAVSVLASFAILGRLLGGVTVTRVPMRTFAIVNMVGQAIGLVLLAWAGTAVTFFAASACFGLTIGNLLMLQPLLIAEAFGLRDYARIFALSQAVTTVGVALGPAMVGLLHDHAGGYAPAFLAMAAVTLCGVGFFVAGGKLPRPELPA